MNAQDINDMPTEKLRRKAIEISSELKWTREQLE